jgi:hypothetical protein
MVGYTVCANLAQPSSDTLDHRACLIDLVQIPAGAPNVKTVTTRNYDAHVVVRLEWWRQ